MTPRGFRFHPRAMEDTGDATFWYEVRSPGAAKAFRAEFGRIMRSIAAAPQRWPADENGFRKVLFHRFPFRAVYRYKDGLVEVIAIAHCKRRPSYWNRR